MKVVAAEASLKYYLLLVEKVVAQSLAPFSRHRYGIRTKS
jgi:hypothetical protein